MSAGFRKSFLGFNCDDVIKYIEASQAKHTRREDDLKATISDLEERLNKALADIKALSEQNASLTAEINEFKSRSAEIEQLSASIGKLYMVSQNSAKNIINNSVESSRIANEEISKNIDSIDCAHTSLAYIRENMEKTANEFVENVNALCNSLENAKNTIAERSSDSEKQLEEFNAIFNKISNI